MPPNLDPSTRDRAPLILTAEQAARAASALSTWFPDDEERAWTDQELLAMHAALEAPTLDEALHSFPASSADRGTAEQEARDAELLNDLRDLLPYIDPAQPQAGPATGAAEEQHKTLHLIEGPCLVPIAGDFDSRDPDAAARFGRRPRRAVGDGTRKDSSAVGATADSIDAAWDTEGWHADQRDLALDQVADLSDTTGYGFTA